MSIQNGFLVANGILLKYSGESKDITIPADVSTIGNRAFLCCENLNSVIMSNNVFSIGEEVFWGCTNLIAVVLPDSVMFIEDNAFYGCDTVSIHGKRGSHAEFYAKKHNIFFVAE